MKIQDKNYLRIGRAVMKNWGFRYFKKAYEPASRHSVYVQRPEMEDWYCEKTNGTEKDWVKSLLDEAGVPK